MGKSNKIYLLLFALLMGAVPFFLQSNYPVMVLNIAALNILVVIGLNLLMGFAGQISLGHAAFFGLGAYLSAVFTVPLGLPILVALVLATAFTAAVAYILAIPTLKLEGHYLVMATLGFNVIIYILMVQMDSVTGGPSGFAGIPHFALGPLVFDSDRKVYYLLWTVATVGIVLSLNLIHSRAGRAMAALSHNEIAARCAGIDTETYKIKIFVLSAAFASVAGSLYAHYLTFISPGTFSIFCSIQLVTMVLVGGIHSLWGSVFGAIFLTVLPEVLQEVKDYSVLVYGIILMAVLVFFPQGLFPGLLEAFKKRWEGSPPEKLVGKEGGGRRMGPPFSSQRHRIAKETRSGEERGILEAREITVRFGGLEALDGLSFSIAPRQIVALIGPNGAGKTTLLNAITGIYSLFSGAILFHGRPIHRLKSFEIAALGINRTFQQAQLFAHMSTLENIMVGLHPKTQSGFLKGMLHLPGERKEEDFIREKAESLLQLFGLLPKAHWGAAHLSVVEQKRLEIARAMASDPELLLLDEPVAGLNIKETEAMGDFILGLKTAGQTIILVEHNMHLVMGIADWVIVLHHGSMIGEGRPEDIQKDCRVIDAYLGNA